MLQRVWRKENIPILLVGMKTGTASMENSMHISQKQVQMELHKAEEQEIKLPTSAGSWKKQKSSWKRFYFCFIDYAKAFDCVDHN